MRNLSLQDPLSTPIVVKKVTPKITKAVKPVTPKVTPKLTATVSPLECGGATVTKASASVTPRVVLKGKTSMGGNNRVKTTPVNKNQASTSQSQKGTNICLEIHLLSKLDTYYCLN